MFVLNITTNITPAIKEEWLTWHQAFFIKEMLDTKLFSAYQFYELMDVEDHGSTYVTQFNFNSFDEYTHYMGEHQKRLSEATFSKWGDQIISFRTVLRIVQ